jgi:hypothetical protein
MLAFYLMGEKSMKISLKLRTKSSGPKKPGETNRKPALLDSNFSYLIAITLFLLFLVSIQKSHAENLPQPQPATAQAVPTAQTVKPIPVQEPQQPSAKTETAAPAPITATPSTAVSTTTPPNPASSQDDLPTPVVSGDTITHEVIRRIVVFPLDTNGNYRKDADLAWWKIRELLSDQQRFLVATKRFMQQNEVFQPRKTFLISDVILLAKLLESDCLITTYVENKKIYMSAYSGQDGLLLWRKHIDINASKPISMQLEDLVTRLIQDFIASMPYQGFQIVDPLNQEPLIEEGSTIMARVDVGARSSAVPGQKVQWLEIDRASPHPLFQGGSKIKVIAEGEVIKNENQVVTVEVKRVKDLKLLRKKSLVSIPDEYKRIYDAYAIKSAKDIQPNLTLLTEPMTDAQEQNEEARPLLVALSSIANIVVAILLAF